MPIPPPPWFDGQTEDVDGVQKTYSLAYNRWKNVSSTPLGEYRTIPSDGSVTREKIASGAVVDDAIVTMSASKIRGVIPASNLPAYVDDVVEFANRPAFPSAGAAGILYVALDTSLVYRWSGSDYVPTGPAAGGLPPAGSVTNQLLADVEANTIKGARVAGRPKDLSPADVRAILIADAGAGPAQRYLGVDGAFAVPNLGVVGGIGPIAVPASAVGLAVSPSQAVIDLGIDGTSCGMFCVAGIFVSPPATVDVSISTNGGQTWTGGLLSFASFVGTKARGGAFTVDGEVGEGKSGLLFPTTSATSLFLEPVGQRLMRVARRDGGALSISRLTVTRIA